MSRHVGRWEVNALASGGAFRKVVEHEFGEAGPDNTVSVKVEYKVETFDVNNAEHRASWRREQGQNALLPQGVVWQ